MSYYDGTKFNNKKYYARNILFCSISLHSHHDMRTTCTHNIEILPANSVSINYKKKVEENVQYVDCSFFFY